MAKPNYGFLKRQKELAKKKKKEEKLKRKQERAAEDISPDAAPEVGGGSVPDTAPDGDSGP